ncbi:CdaR family transcriptional regulator [Anaerosacchariphilus polymeriproducens]|uniref:Sugar diacid utilization regulator SdaR n=1 Tax=Anaerosacchariphilus polymeriproducens TaxID=1812858 RepID=A0A371AYV0_9FIRM|nr:sugar diacid recognition domain-containing protein [Anaerosacchariphilus polymeriproducens]RDU24650.1 sugar diacid utilization regulator SdaR [Anaerosacchariphilus polymeriproducens]
MPAEINQKIAQQIVETVKDVCGHNVNFMNTDGIIFASTDISRIGDFHEIGKQVIQSCKSLEVENNDSFRGTHKGVNIPFIHNGEVIAVIGISGIPKEVRKYAYLAQKITSLILREHELNVQNHNQKAQLDYVIRSLITNSNMNHDFFMGFIESNNISFTSSYRTILIILNSRYNPSNLSMVEHQIYQVFDFTGCNFYTFNYPNEYVLILEDETFQKWAYLFEDLTKKYKEFLKVGVGSKTTLTKQHHSYEAAKLALYSLQVNENLAFFDELDLEILLGSVSNDAKEQFLRKTINKLSKKELVLLKTYFQCDMSLKNTCETLYLHKNTLQYQLDKIWRSCGYNPRSFKDAAILYMGVKLL